MSDRVPVLTLVTVGIRSSFIAFHRWVSAPDGVSFLRDYHRHKFGVSVEIRVSALDRELEYFTVQRRLDAYLQSKLAGQYQNASCETFALEILEFLAEYYTDTLFIKVTVDEDGENYSTVERVWAVGR